MQYQQPKHEALKCTYKDCQRLQTMDGEFCNLHFSSDWADQQTQDIMDAILEHLQDALEQTRPENKKEARLLSTTLAKAIKTYSLDFLLLDLENQHPKNCTCPDCSSIS